MLSCRRQVALLGMVAEAPPASHLWRGDALIDGACARVHGQASVLRLIGKHTRRCRCRCHWWCRGLLPCLML